MHPNVRNGGNIQANNVTREGFSLTFLRHANIEAFLESTALAHVSIGWVNKATLETQAVRL